MRLIYKGDGDYDLIEGMVKFQLSYDGSDYMIGDWEIWDVTVGDQSTGARGYVGDHGQFHYLLESLARNENGTLPDEPDDDHVGEVGIAE